MYRFQCIEEHNHKIMVIVFKQMGEEEPEMHLNPVKVLQELEEVLPENAVLVADGGDFVATAAYTVR